MVNKAGPKKAAYDKAYNARPEQKKRRAARGRARYDLEKAGRVRKGDGKDVDHKDFNPMNENPSNLRVMDDQANRGRKPPKLRKRK